MARFYQEARAAATIHHPHVCPVYDVGEIDGVHYLTMAFIEGKPLEEWVASGKQLTHRQIATLGRKIADALSEAHKRGVIHRDLKPANIMIDKRGEPVVMDFGLARRAATSDDEKRLTQFGTVMGSPAYMSPEQIRGETETTGPATDIFSLGVILYELIARQLPFDGATVGAVPAQILLQEPAPLRSVCPEVDPVLESICMRALAKKPEERHRSMTQMAAALKGYLENRPPAAVAETTAPPEATLAAAPRPNSGIQASELGGRSMVVAQQEREEREERSRPSKGSDRARRRKKVEKPAPRPWVWIASGVAAILVVGGIAYAIKSSRKPEHASGGETPGDHQPRSTPPPPSTPLGFHSLFNGKDLSGWKVDSGDPAVWRVEGGNLAFHVSRSEAAGGLAPD